MKFVTSVSRMDFMIEGQPKRDGKIRNVIPITNKLLL